jgi:hypothetical protein
MSYDHWKATNPEDEELECCPQPSEDTELEELYRLCAKKDAQIQLLKTHLKMAARVIEIWAPESASATSKVIAQLREMAE